MAPPDMQASVTSSDVCHTIVNFHKANYVWIIDNYRSVHDKRGAVITSLPFSPDDDNFKWYLCLNPKYSNSNSVALHLYMHDPNSLPKYSPITGNVKLSMMNAENRETITNNMDFTIASNVSTGAYTGFFNFVDRNQLFAETNHLLPQDRLTITCEVSYIKKTDIVNISGQSFSSSHEEHVSTSLEDIDTLFMDEEFSDVTLCVKDKTYPAHKGILAARSSVFKAMLRTDMTEKKSNRIEITDIDESVFIEMLRFIYTGTSEDLESMVSELLEAADKYDLKKLKILCEKEMYKNLSTDSVVDILILADRHNAEVLKTQALQYIKVNSYNTNILTKEVRKDLVTFYPHILLEILDAFGKASIQEL